MSAFKIPIQIQLVDVVVVRRPEEEAETEGPEVFDNVVDVVVIVGSRTQSQEEQNEECRRQGGF
jgi:hypothetical protein